MNLETIIEEDLSIIQSNIKKKS